MSAHSLIPDQVRDISPPFCQPLRQPLAGGSPTRQHPSAQLDTKGPGRSKLKHSFEAASGSQLLKLRLTAQEISLLESCKQR